MIKNIIIGTIIIFVIVYFVDPGALTPWKDAAENAGKVTANEVKKVGEKVDKEARDDAHKDSVIDKTKDRITDAVTGK